MVVLTIRTIIYGDDQEVNPCASNLLHQIFMSNYYYEPCFTITHKQLRLFGLNFLEILIFGGSRKIDLCGPFLLTLWTYFHCEMLRIISFYHTIQLLWNGLYKREFKKLPRPNQIFRASLEYRSTITQQILSKYFKNWHFFHITIFHNIWRERLKKWTDLKYFQ